MSNLPARSDFEVKRTIDFVLLSTEDASQIFRHLKVKYNILITSNNFYK